MAEVHPTAIVDKRALLADGVVVGPWCVIEGDVRIGPGTKLLHRVTLRGPLTVGARNVLYPNACIGYEPQDRKFDPARGDAGIVIGDENLIREGVTIHRATQARPTTVGHRNFLMVNSHIGHDDQLGSDITMANGVLLAGHVEVGDKVIIGGNTAIHQFCRIGRMSMVSGMVGITQDVPPFVTVYPSRKVGSLNLVGLRRGGYRDHIAALKQALDVLYHRRHTAGQAAAIIEQQLAGDALCRELAAFLRTSKRGITRGGAAVAEVAAEATA